MLKTTESALGTLSGATVLVVDDEPTNHLVLEGMLAPLGCTIMTAMSGEEALAMAANETPDVMLLDVMMPGVDGFDVCRRLKSEAATALIPVVMVSALDAEQHKLRGLQVGADEFLRKPVDHVELEARVRSLVQRSRAQASLHRTEDVLDALATAIDIRDDVTGGHVRRLRENADLFATALDLDPEERRLLRWAAVLHDVGKLGMPDAVLSKPGPLDDDEWAIMREHSVLGEAIVAPLAGLADVRPIVRHHHERWDGTGYPDGLSGEDIPRLARIFQVLDVFDALTAQRPYKPAMGRVEATEVLLEMAGRVLDPFVTEAFVGQVAAEARVQREVTV